MRPAVLAGAAVLACLAGPVQAAPPMPCSSPADLQAAAASHHLTGQDLVALGDPALCVGLRQVRNGRLDWQLLVVRHREDPDRLLWYAPHTNESAAFANGIAAVARHHGTLVAVRTADGARCLEGQDPNRVFGSLQGAGNSCRSGGARCVPSAAASVPPFTAEVLGWRAGDAAIVGLHTNQRGFDSSANCPRPAGTGNITATCSRSNLTALHPRGTARGASPDDTMVYVAGTGSIEQTFGGDAGLAAVVGDLRQSGTNVIFERVQQTDCSLSNYAVQHGMPHYFNVEVETSDAAGQAAIIDDLVASLARHRLIAAPRP